MRRFVWLLGIGFWLVPDSAHALQLHWFSGSTDLSFTAARRCTLVVHADSAEQRLPVEWRLVWLADGSSIQPISLGPITACLGDIAQVTAAVLCSTPTAAGSTAFFLLDLPAGSKGKLKAAALDPSHQDSLRVLQSSDVTFNGGVAGDYPPLILHASRLHRSDVLQVTASGVGLSPISAAALVAPDTSWRVPLTISQQSYTSLRASASIPALMPASVLQLTAPTGGTAVGDIPPDIPVPPITSASIASYIDSTGAYYPKDFAFFYDGLSHFHLFFIRHNGHLSCTQGALNEKYLAHVSSGDLVHWSPPDTTSFTTAQSAGPWDANHVWAPTIIQPPGPTYYMFYTGVDNQGNQSIGYATTQDINTPTINWLRQSVPVFKATNTSWADTTHPQQFRDPFVMLDPFNSGHWLMYVAAQMKHVSQCDSMFIGVGKSVGTSLTQWQDKWPLYETDKNHTFRGRAPRRVEKGSGVIFRLHSTSRPDGRRTGGLRRARTYQGRSCA